MRFKRLMLPAILLVAGAAQAANEIEFIYPSGSTLYAILRQPSTVKVWDPAAFAWEDWSDGAIADYDVALADGSGDYYSVSFPSAITAGSYTVTIYEQAGGSPAITDDVLGSGSIAWTGTAARTLASTALSSDGLDTVSVTEPTGPATTFRQMVVQLWLRFFAKTTMTSSILTAYNTSNVAITQQSLADDGTTQTMGKAAAP